MRVTDIDYSGMVRTILVMSFAGSVTALLLLLLKPVIRNRLPKKIQHCLWLVVLAALVMPVSWIVVFPRSATSDGRPISLTPIHDTVQQRFGAVNEIPARHTVISQGTGQRGPGRQRLGLPGMERPETGQMQAVSNPGDSNANAQFLHSATCSLPPSSSLRSVYIDSVMIEK